MKVSIFLKKCGLLQILVIANFLCFSQKKDMAFHGTWGDTYWRFEFKKNGDYKRISAGHYGDRVTKGNYVVIGDTIKLLSGFKDTHGTLNEYYRIGSDSALIDLRMRLGYKLDKGDDKYFPFCGRREIEFPYLTTKDSVIKNDFYTVLTIAILSEELTHYFPLTDTIKKVKFANFYCLKNMGINNRVSIQFFDKNEMKGTPFFYIFGVVNKGEEITLNIKHSEFDIEFRFLFIKKGKDWEYTSEILNE